MMGGLAGFAALALFLILGLWWAGVRERPVYERPAVLIQSWFSPMFRLARGLLFAAGWFLAVPAFPRISAGLALALIAAAGWKGFVASRGYRRRMFRRAFEAERARDPAAGDVQILRRILHALHPRWGDELIEQIATDQPTPEGVADMVVRMERGGLPRGFHPLRMLRRRG